MFDADEKIVLFNQRYVDMMKLSADDLTGLSLLELLRRRKASGLSPAIRSSLTDEVLAAYAGRPASHQDHGIRRRPRVALRQSADAAGRLGGHVRGHHRTETVRTGAASGTGVPEPDHRQRAGDDRGEGRGRAEDLFTPIAPPRRSGDFPARKPSARRCASCSRNGDVDVIDNADAEAVRSGTPIVREAHPSMVIPGDRASGVVKAAHHSRRRRQAAPCWSASSRT